MKHRVRTHHWRNGRLEVLDNWFDSLEEAMGFANSSDGHSVKVYDPSGAIIHSATPSVQTNTYA
jgi:hypothetical protein